MSTIDMFEPERTSALSQWFTPAWIARRLALWLPVEPDGYVLEPSAGSGELVEGLVRAGWPLDRIIACEIDPVWCAYLRTRFGSALRVIEGDFLGLSTQLTLRALPVRHALLNPPYEDDADVAFIEACLRLLGFAGRAVCLVKTDIEYSAGRAPLWAQTARVSRRARLIERPAFGRHVDGQRQGGAERNYVGLELMARNRPRVPGEVEVVAEEAWSRHDHEDVWTRMVVLGADRQRATEPHESPSKQGETGDRKTAANRPDPDANRERGGAA